MTDIEIIHQFAERNMLVEKYLLNELAGADLEDFEQHLFECEICFEAAKAGQAFTENISRQPRKSLVQRIKEFWASHFSMPKEGQR